MIDESYQNKLIDRLKQLKNRSINRYQSLKAINDYVSIFYTN